MSGNPPKFTAKERAFLKMGLESDHLLFTRWQMRVREDTQMKIGGFHRVMADVIDGVFNGTYRRVLITVPPGTTKTEMVSLGVIARGLAINPKARFMNLSFSDSLVKDNSRKIKELVESDEYQKMWDVKLKADAKRKGLWITEQNGQAFFASSKGQVTGFRAGTMEDGFTGCIILDDLLKPEDAFSPKSMEAVNRRINNTIKSRLMKESVPIIMVMQRIAEDDPANFVLTGGTREDWVHLNLPLILDDTKEYNPEYTHGIPYEHGLPNGILWEDKWKEDDVKTLKADNYTFTSQYMQAPEQSEDCIFEQGWFGRYDSINPEHIKRIIIYGDTAQKTEEKNDYSVFQAWAEMKAPEDKVSSLFLLDQIRDKFNPDDLITEAKKFWDKHKRTHGMNRKGATQFRIEDASSGTGLIYQLKKKGVPVKGIVRGNQSKLSRFYDAVPPIKQGRVYIPDGEIIDVNGSILTDGEFVYKYLKEMRSINKFMTQDNDDQADPTADAVREMLINKGAGLYDNL